MEHTKSSEQDIHYLKKLNLANAELIVNTNGNTTAIPNKPVGISTKIWNFRQSCVAAIAKNNATKVVQAAFVRKSLKNKTLSSLYSCFKKHYFPKIKYLLNVSNSLKL